MILPADSPAALKHAVALLKAGELVAIPTETVYGLAADASNPQATLKIFQLKQRPVTNPLIVHLANVDQLPDWAMAIPAVAYQLAKAFWPGPMTLILPKAAWVPVEVTGGQTTIALRIPAHPATLALLKVFGSGLAAPSANRFTQLSPTTAHHVEQAFGPELLILDGGPSVVGIESTIIDCSGEQVAILRPGMLSGDAISAIIGQGILYNPSSAIKRPGQHWLHYAPQASLCLVPSDRFIAEWVKANPANTGAIIYTPDFITPSSRVCLLNHEPVAYARELYAALHRLDLAGCHQILVELPPAQPVWCAVLERLHKAAGVEVVDDYTHCT